MLMTDVGCGSRPAARREAIGVLSGIRIAHFGAGCVELEGVLARPREVGNVSGGLLGTVETVEAMGFWRGVDMTDASAWRGETDGPASVLLPMAAAAPMVYAPTNGGRSAAVRPVTSTIALLDRHAARAAAPAAQVKSALPTVLVARTNQIQAKTQAFTRRHPDSRGPSPTKPPA